MSEWILFIAAFICFFIAGTSLIILIIPQNNRSKVELRLLQLAQELTPYKLEQSATPKASWFALLSAKIITHWQERFNLHWLPFYQHLQALHGEKEQQKLLVELALKLFICCIISLFLFSSFPWHQQGFASIASTALLATLYYRYLSAQQIKAYEEQLPSIIEHLARAVSTGLSVPQGLASCAQSCQQPASSELQRLSQQLALGIRLEQAMAEAKQRIPVREFNFLAVILILNQQTGGRLSEALNNLANSLRDRKAMRLKLSTLTSEPRTAAAIVSLFPPLTMLGLWIFNPAQWDFLWHDPSGQSILIYASSSIIFGLLVIRRLSSGGLS